VQQMPGRDVYLDGLLGRSIEAPYCITREAQPGDGMWLSKQGRLEIIQFNTNIIAEIHRAAFGEGARSSEMPTPAQARC
jgi:hypothetical protein